MPSPMGVLTGVEPPPFRLPGSHFAVALLFLGAGAIALVLAGPELASGSFLSPRVAAVTHLFTLGWITTSIMGALYQIFPVALGRETRWIGLAYLTLGLHASGLVVFVTGLATVRPALTIAGASALSLGVLLFAINLGATLRRPGARDTTWWALAAAGFFLVGTMVMGGLLASNLAWPYLGADRLTALVTHLHIGLVGWALLVLVGIAQKLLPMFLLSPENPKGGRWPVALLAGGTMLLFALHHAPWTWARWLPAAVLVAGVAVFLRQARHFFAVRKRKALDPGLRLAAAALVLLGAATAVGGVIVFAGFVRPATVTAYVGALVLSITLFIAAFYYKIVPFLVWYHRFAPLAGRGPTPTVAELYSAPVASVAATLLTVGGVALIASIGAGLLGGVRVGAGVFAAGAVLEGAQMARLSRVRAR